MNSQMIERLLCPESLKSFNSSKIVGNKKWISCDFYKTNNPISLSMMIKMVRDYLLKINLSKEDFASFGEMPLYHSDVHGITHNERVMILGTCISAVENLPKDEFLILLAGCKFHDIGRIDDEYDEGHGVRGAKMLRSARLFQKEENKVLCEIVKLHSVPDIYLEKYKKAKEEIGKKIYRLGRILKDSDNLDRIRLGLEFLDTTYLRTDSAKQLPDTAVDLFAFHNFLLGNLEKYQEILVSFASSSEKN